MTVELDNFNTPQKKEYVVATVTIGLILSNVSFALRVWARLVTIKTLRGEDWFMFSGLLLSYATAVCLLYGKNSHHTLDESKRTNDDDSRTLNWSRGAFPRSDARSAQRISAGKCKAKTLS